MPPTWARSFHRWLFLLLRAQASEELCRCNFSHQVLNFYAHFFLSQFKIVNMRCCWRRLDLRPQHSFADFQRSLISGCEGASRGHFPAGERRSGPPSCMPGTAVWKPESWRMYSKLTSHNVWWYLKDSNRVQVLLPLLRYWKLASQGTERR